MKLPPVFGSSSMLNPKKYWRVNSARVSASHTLSDVLAM
jgi:hypothetical protein